MLAHFQSSGICPVSSVALNMMDRGTDKMLAASRRIRGCTMSGPGLLLLSSRVSSSSTRRGSISMSSMASGVISASRSGSSLGSSVNTEKKNGARALAFAWSSSVNSPFSFLRSGIPGL